MTRTTPVTRAFLPPLADVQELLRGIWESGQLTNNGALVQRLEAALISWHGGPAHFMGNGTIALQIALQALEVEGEVVTTPFSYVASTTAILWERCTPVMADIHPATFCIDPARIEERITPRTAAILATHVYGLPCDVQAIERIAQRHGLKVIYDAAHAFGSEYQGRPLLAYGDASTCSFHATKLFHSAEGGSVRCSDAIVHERARLLRQFGHIHDDHFLPGINGKNSELHAAVGLAVLPHMEAILARRAEQWQRYQQAFTGSAVGMATVPIGTKYNHAYFPAVFRDEAEALRVRDALGVEGIVPRRYFYPALNTLPYIRKNGDCPIAEDVAPRVMCLPLFHVLETSVQDRVAEVVLRTVAAG